uniref:Steroid 5-alpha reductase C-terminal domain-containing protein n=1 Tax=Chrysotila carterae TaxID=13221 RepID=A0A7S4B4B3_CHRCT|mmetsp:Transcript_14129/g.29818  ORF Transcript_14129/g.29818 Transcript_14129/m.29818 type:complete len:315 (+) Transcript_14129:106-1050(+)
MDAGLLFLIAFGATCAMQLSCFVIAYLCKFDKITDLAGSANFVLVAVMTLLLAPEQPPTTRQIVVTCLVSACRVQLALWLFYRVLKRGKDDRFDEVRGNFFYFLAFWIWQILWVYVVSVSVIFINSSSDDPPLGAWDYIGWITFAVGWVLQVAADLQKLRFRSDPANKRRVCTTGVWRLSRHPNYCGEVLIWWGIFIAGIPLYVKDPVGFSTIVSPLFTMGVLLALTGIPQAEGQAAKRWFDGGDMQRQFEDYFASTPPLWLCPPAIYRQLPLALKRVLCFELPMYEYKPSLADDGPPEATRNAKPPITVHQQQ